LLLANRNWFVLASKTINVLRSDSLLMSDTTADTDDTRRPALLKGIPFK